MYMAVSGLYHFKNFSKYLLLNLIFLEQLSLIPYDACSHFIKFPKNFLTFFPPRKNSSSSTVNSKAASKKQRESHLARDKGTRN